MIGEFERKSPREVIQGCSCEIKEGERVSKTGRRRFKSARSFSIAVLGCLSFSCIFSRTVLPYRTMHIQHRYGWHRYVVPGIICLIGIVIPLAQYYFRRFDDNTFTSWHLIFLATPRLNYFSCLDLRLCLVGIKSVFTHSVALTSRALPLSCMLFATAFFWSNPK